MSEHDTGVGDDIRNVVQDITGKAKKVAGIVTGDEHLEDEGRAQSEEATVRKFRDDLEVDEARDTARHPDN